MEIKELIIPVPWGHIQAKAWGSSNDPIILVLHGKQDNAGSFDSLIPLLSQRFYYICIDFPSHGLSSPFPPHVQINIMMFVMALKYVVDFFKLKKISVIAHSLGARVLINYAFIYPDTIERFVSLDVITLWPVEANFYAATNSENIKGFQRTLEKLVKNQPPEYTYEEALSRVMEARPTVICKRGAENMLKRALIPVREDKFHFSMDQRLKHIYFQPLSCKNLASLVKESRFKFPHLILLSSETTQLKFFESSEPILKELEKNKKCKMIVVKGNHDVHNNNPELVAKYINKFFDIYKLIPSKI